MKNGLEKYINQLLYVDLLSIQMQIIKRSEGSDYINTDWLLDINYCE